MSDSVFVNNRAIVCKASGGKSIAAFPDVCMTPPPPPIGPLPIPYPNTAFASDLTDGSKDVKVENKEVCLKDVSYLKKSVGNEAATKSQGANLITHTIQGKAYFTSWSMDVKFEGKNVCRHLDIATHNHNPVPGGTPPWPQMSDVDMGMEACEELENEIPQAEADLTASQKRGARTVTAAKFTQSNGKSSILWGSSKHLSKGRFEGPNPWVAGRGGPGSRHNTTSDIPGYSHPLSPQGPKCSHTEARILDTLFAATPPAGKGDTLTMRIKWVNKEGESRDPCNTCEKAIAAAQGAGLKIDLC